MTDRSNSRARIAFGLALAGLVACGLWQNQRLRAAQLEEKKALYGERLRTAQIIVENEMLAAAALTSADPRTRDRARRLLTQSPR